MMLLGSRLAPTRGSQVGTWERRISSSKFFSSDTGRYRALIFGFYHILVDLYQVCSYDARGVQNWPHPGGHKLEHRNKENQLQNFSSLKLEGLEL